MDSSEIVKHEIKRKSMHMVLNLLGMGIGQPSESAHVHAFNVACGDMVLIGVAGNSVGLSSAALSRAVSSRSLRRWGTVDFLQHRIVDLCAKRPINCLQIRAMSVSCYLYAMSQSSSQVGNEFNSVWCRPLSDEIGHHQLAIGVERCPSPDRAESKLTFHFLGKIFVFSETKRPDFIALDAFASEISQCPILIFSAGCAEIGKQFQNGGLGYAGHAHRAVDACALNECCYDLRSFLSAQLIHGAPLVQAVMRQALCLHYDKASRRMQA